MSLHGGLAFPIEFLTGSGIWEKFVEGCPLKYVSPNALRFHHGDAWGPSIAAVAGHREVPPRGLRAAGFREAERRR